MNRSDEESTGRANLRLAWLLKIIRYRRMLLVLLLLGAALSFGLVYGAPAVGLTENRWIHYEAQILIQTIPLPELIERSTGIRLYDLAYRGLHSTETVSRLYALALHSAGLRDSPEPDTALRTYVRTDFIGQNLTTRVDSNTGEVIVVIRHPDRDVVDAFVSQMANDPGTVATEAFLPTVTIAIERLESERAQVLAPLQVGVESASPPILSAEARYWLYGSYSVALSYAKDLRTNLAQYFHISDHVVPTKMERTAARTTALVVGLLMTAFVSAGIVLLFAAIRSVLADSSTRDRLRAAWQRVDRAPEE